MMRSVRELLGYMVRGADGDLGKLHDLLLVEPDWAIRYFEVDVGHWFSKHRVFISPQVLEKPDWSAAVLPVSLTRRELEEAPPSAEQKQLAEEHDETLQPYAAWPTYWTGWPLDPASATLIASAVSASVRNQAAMEPPAHARHLRSSRVALRCQGYAADGELGRVDDLLVDDRHWLIRYLVVNTHSWLPDRKVLVAPAWIDRVNWAEETIAVRLHREAVRHSPAYDPAAPPTRDYEDRLCDHYGRAKYWEMEAEPVRAHYPCRQCGRVFLTPLELQAHLKSCAPARSPRQAETNLRGRGN